jgi:hypothetical protein
MVNLTNKTSVTWEALQPLLTTHPFVGTFVVPTPGSAPTEVLQARALRTGKMYYFADGSTRLTEAEVISANMPYPGGPRVRFLVLAGLFFLLAVSPLSPPFNKLLPPLESGMKNAVLHERQEHGLMHDRTIQ